MIKGVVFDIDAISPSVKNFIDCSLKAGVKLALAGAKDSVHLEKVLSLAGIAPSSFSFLAYESAVKREKPFGDIYKLCFLSLGLSNEECFVVGSNTQDHIAAKDALCLSVSLKSQLTDSVLQEQIESGADLVYSSLLLFPAFLNLTEFDALFWQEVKNFYDKTIIGDLLSSALAVQEKAYAPYSKFKVGAAIYTGNGNVYKGCNVENASFGGSICAERGASMGAIASEGKTSFKLIAIASSAQEPAPPCAICRQFLSEFMAPTGQVYLISRTSNVIRHYSFTSLLPCSFTEF